MPNGDYSLSRDDWKRIRAFFDERSAILVDFATAHNLAIDKYYHDSPSWTFRFRHPKSGVGGVEVKRVSESSIRVNMSWYIDEYENFTRHAKQEESSELAVAKIDLTKVLEDSLKRALGWNREELTPHDAKNPWSDYSKEEWEKLWSVERFPLRFPLLKP